MSVFKIHRLAGSTAAATAVCRAARVLLHAGIVFGTVLPGCATDLPVDQPTAAQMLYCPTALAKNPSQNVVYVLNTDFDQRYGAGWITSVDLDAFFAGDLTTANVSVDRQALRRQAMIPPLGGRFVLDAAGTHGYVPHRGTGLLTMLDVDPHDAGLVRCAANGGTRSGVNRVLEHSDCDQEHVVDLVTQVQQFATTQGDLQVRARDLLDPFAVALLPSPSNAVLIGYLGSSWLTSLNVATVPPSVTQHVGVLSGGTVSLVLPGTHTVVAASRRIRGQDKVASVYRLTVPDLSNPIGDSATAEMGASDLTNLTPSPDGSRFYALGQRPDSLVVLRQSTTPTQQQAMGPVTQQAGLQVVWAEAIMDAHLTDIVYLQRAVGRDLLVACSLDQNLLYFFTPQGDQVQLIGRLPLTWPDGTPVDGPSSLLHIGYAGRDYVLVSTFYDHGLLAVDVTDASFINFSQVRQFAETEVTHVRRTHS